MIRSGPILSGIITSIIVCLAGGTARADVPVDAKPTRIFYIGNSVTDQINYAGLATMADEKGHPIIWGRHMIPGAPLFYMWTHEDGFKTDAYGSSRNALANFQWDVISLEPFDRNFHDGSADAPEGDLDNAQRYIDLAVKKSPEARFFIYERWPRISRNNRGFDFDKNAYKNATGQVDLRKIDNIDDYTDRWLRTYGKHPWDGSEESRDYFQRLTLALRQQNPTRKDKIHLVPVGDVMNELHQMMKSGKVPGWTSIYQFYADGIHLNETGRYMVGCTYYATIFKADPHGLDYKPYSISDAGIARVIQDVAWKIVQANALDGVSGSN